MIISLWFIVLGVWLTSVVKIYKSNFEFSMKWLVIMYVSVAVLNVIAFGFMGD